MVPRRPKYTIEMLEEAARESLSVSELGRPYRCEGCGLGPEWNAKPLVLHNDHVNGLHHDYSAGNLRFLCPNCHAQTETFGTLNRAYAGVA